MNKTFTACLVSALALLALPVLQAEEATSETHEGLQRLLQRYPEADLDGDGVLTMDEMRQFRMQLWQEESDVGEPVAREDPETEPTPVPRHGEPYFAQAPYGTLRGQVFDLWLPRNAAPPRPTIIYLIAADQTPAAPLLESALNADLGVCVIHGRDQGDDDSYFEDVGLALEFLVERNAAYGIRQSHMGLFATADRAEHALVAAFKPAWGEATLPAVIRCVALLDAPEAETPEAGEASVLEQVYPAFYASLDETPNLPAVALLSARQDNGEGLQQALEQLGAETMRHTASDTEREVHLLRRAALFFERRLALEPERAD